MTLNEIAGKKTPPPAVPEIGGRIVLSASAPAAANGATVYMGPSRPAPLWEPRVPGQDERLLGSECLADTIPMGFPSEATDQLWEEARMTPVARLMAVLSEDRSRVWMALCSPGRPPLLLHWLPVAGTMTLHGEGSLTQMEDQRPSLQPPPPFPSDALCATSPERPAGESSSPGCPPADAPGAGSPGADPFPSGAVCAPEPCGSMPREPHE